MKLTRNESTWIVILHAVWQALHLFAAVAATAYGFKYGDVITGIIGGLGLILTAAEIFVTTCVAVHEGTKDKIAQALVDRDVGVLGSAVEYGTEERTEDGA